MICQRQGNKLIMPEQWEKDIYNKICPVCKKENKRQYRCCSPGCTSKFWETAVWSFDLPVKCFKRDNFTCVKCGKSNAPYFAWLKRKHSWEDKQNKPLMYCIEYEVSTGDKEPEYFKLEADHIDPIALGGDEYDLDNYQTLCKECHKNKTSGEAKLFALARKNQSRLF